jgi:hypothetical protein
MDGGTWPMPRYRDELSDVGGLSGTDIANIADLSKATVSRWRAGTARPQPSTQLLLPDLFFVDGRLRNTTPRRKSAPGCSPCTGNRRP